MNIQLIAPKLPPQMDGIGHYTALLATALSSAACVGIMTGRGQEYEEIPGVTTEPIFDVDKPQSFQRIVNRVMADPPDWLFLQYNAFSYGRRGLNLHLPAVIREVRRRCPQTRFALMVHEPFVPVLDWKHALMTTWQRWQLWSLGNSADVVFFSIDPWARTFRPWFPKAPVLHLPVGSNIPLVPTSRQSVRERLGIPEGRLVVGLFGQAHSSSLLHWLPDSVDRLKDSGYDPLVLYIGPQEGRVRQALGSRAMHATGPLPAPDVSEHLAAADIFLVPFVDGISTRRGSLMAGLQHGLPTVGTVGHHTDRMLSDENDKAFLLTEVGSPDDFHRSVLKLAADPVFRARLGAEGQRFFQANFTWNGIAQRVLGEMERVSTTPSA